MQDFNYVSSVQGRIVTRFASLRQPVAQYIGATRPLGKEHRGKKIVWNTEEVVAIPLREWRKYSREYRSSVASGALVMRTEKDHKSWLAKRKAQSEEVAAKAKAKVDEAQAEAEAKAKAAAAPSTKRTSKRSKS